MFSPIALLWEERGFFMPGRMKKNLYFRREIVLRSHPERKRHLNLIQVTQLQKSEDPSPSDLFRVTAVVNLTSSLSSSQTISPSNLNLGPRQAEAVGTKRLYRENRDVEGWRRATCVLGVWEENERYGGGQRSPIRYVGEWVRRILECSRA